MMLINIKMADKPKFTIRNFLIPCLLVSTLMFNLAMLYRNHYVHVEPELCNVVECNNVNNATKVTWDDYIHVAFFAKYAYKNMKIIRGMAGMFDSILDNTDSPIHLHVLLDLFSRQRTARTLRQVARSFHRRLNITFYDVKEMAAQNQEPISIIKKHFFSKDVGRYNDDIFFLTEVFHDAFPNRIKRLIFLDVDLKFLTDIKFLHDQFDKFQPQNVLAIGPDLQPQYREDFAKFRKLNPGTVVGSSRPGRQGFNTGVVLFDLDRMRNSELYNSLLNDTLLEKLCNKYEFEGYLGHQDFYTLTGMEFPELYYRLDCSWNRQLDVGWKNVVGGEIFELYHECSGKINILHANGDSMLPKELKYKLSM